jgi:hypothetical protein
MIVTNENIGLNGGLNGFWGWVRSHKAQISKVLSYLTGGVGSAIFDGIIEADTALNISDAAASQNSITQRIAPSPDPTPAEQTILNPWVTNVLTPFYKAFLIKLDNGFKSQDFNIQIATINKALLQIAYIKQYFQDNELQGLSTNAQGARLALIESVFQPVQDAIDTIISQHQTDINLITYNATLSEADRLELINLTPELQSYETVQAQHYVATVTTAQPPLTVNSKETTVAPIAPQPATTATKSTAWLWIAGAMSALVLLYPEKASTK